MNPHLEFRTVGVAGFVRVGDCWFVARVRVGTYWTSLSEGLGYRA